MGRQAQFGGDLLGRPILPVFARDHGTLARRETGQGSPKMRAFDASWLGELHRRLGQYHEAVRWFGRVINDKKIVDASMIRASREMWQMIREDMTGKGQELPEEMKEA